MVTTWALQYNHIAIVRGVYYIIKYYIALSLAIKYIINTRCNAGEWFAMHAFALFASNITNITNVIRNMGVGNIDNFAYLRLNK